MKKLFLFLFAAAVFAGCNDEDTQYFGIVEAGDPTKANQEETIIKGSAYTNGTLTGIGLYFKEADAAEWTKIDLRDEVKNMIFKHTDPTLVVDTEYQYQAYLTIAETSEEYLGAVRSFTPQMTATVDDPEPTVVRESDTELTVSGTVSVKLLEGEEIKSISVHISGMRPEYTLTVADNILTDNLVVDVDYTKFAYSIDYTSPNIPDNGDNKMVVTYKITVDKGDGETYTIESHEAEEVF